MRFIIDVRYFVSGEELYMSELEGIDIGRSIPDIQLKNATMRYAGHCDIIRVTDDYSPEFREEPTDAICVSSHDISPIYIEITRIYEDIVEKKMYSAGYHTANAAGMLSRLCADAKRVR